MRLTATEKSRRKSVFVLADGTKIAAQKVKTGEWHLETRTEGPEVAGAFVGNSTAGEERRNTSFGKSRPSGVGAKEAAKRKRGFLLTAQKATPKKTVPFLKVHSLLMKDLVLTIPLPLVEILSPLQRAV